MRTQRDFIYFTTQPTTGPNQLTDLWRFCACVITVLLMETGDGKAGRRGDSGWGTVDRRPVGQQLANWAGTSILLAAPVSVRLSSLVQHHYWPGFRLWLNCTWTWQQILISRKHRITVTMTLTFLITSIIAFIHFTMCASESGKILYVCISISKRKRKMCNKIL